MLSIEVSKRTLADSNPLLPSPYSPGSQVPKAPHEMHVKVITAPNATRGH